ncbi:DUF4393 domain-containing protein [Pseudoclavibacter helvolus]|uniref:DUF4393 domain-containing protein n=1 Tax=Pseudoclavibacter helvolus TaxID=255205 RepID=UPI0008382979|nr:DUF4393 domain-containing protein [Pseudoclavibacter helvolus]
MSESDPLSQVKVGVGVVSEIAAMARDNPHAQEAGRSLARSAVVLADTVATVLMPLAAANFAVRKFETYVRDSFQARLARKTANIPEESLQEPAASIAGPTMQALVWAHEDESLEDLYLALLASAMDDRTAESTHPAFVDIIRQLSPAEADFLTSYLSPKFARAPIVNITSRSIDALGSRVLFRNVLTVAQWPEWEFGMHKNWETWIDNWSRLGLVSVNFNGWLLGDDAYSWVESRPEYAYAAKNLEEGREVGIDKGVLEITSFGMRFAEAVGIVVPEVMGEPAVEDSGQA